MTAIMKRTDTHNTTRCPGRTIKWIAIHYTAGTNSRPGAALGVAGWFKNPENRGGSADFIVDDVTTVQYNSDIRNRYCWAVGGRKYPNSKGGSLYGTVTNRNSISVEICSTSKNGQVLKENDPGWSFTDAALDRAVELTQCLMKEFGVDADHVIRHYDVSGKLCPGIIGWNKESGSEKGWLAFKARLASPAATTAASASASAQSGDTEEAVWDFLRGKGLSDCAVAGIMGNLHAESSLRANNLQDSFKKRLELSNEKYTESVDTGAYQNFAMDGAGYGLAQWTYWKRKAALYDYAKAEDKSVGDLTLQLAFLWKELQTDYPALLNALSVAASVQEASNAFLFQFERPADMGEAVQQKRASFGQAYYDRHSLPRVVRVAVDRLNVRSGPGTEYPVSGSVKRGDAYTFHPALEILNAVRPEIAPSVLPLYTQLAADAHDFEILVVLAFGAQSIGSHSTAFPDFHAFSVFHDAFSFTRVFRIAQRVMVIIHRAIRACNHTPLYRLTQLVEGRFLFFCFRAMLTNGGHPAS